MGSGDSAPQGQLDPQNSPQVTGQILISVHGSRKTGKTALIHRMQNRKFETTYSPTPSIQSTQILWRSITYPEEFLRVEVWDVVDEALPDTIESEMRIAAPDAGSVDTFSRADGIIVMYDPSRKDTVMFATSVIESAPAKVPIVVIANFLDQRGNRPKVHQMLMQYMERIVHVQVSVRSNKGLPVVAKWLDEALQFSKYKYYCALYRRTGDEMEELAADINDVAEREMKPRTYVKPVAARREQPKEEVKSEPVAAEDRPSLNELLMAGNSASSDKSYHSGDEQSDDQPPEPETCPEEEDRPNDGEAETTTVAPDEEEATTEPEVASAVTPEAQDETAAEEGSEQDEEVY